MEFEGFGLALEEGLSITTAPAFHEPERAPGDDYFFFHRGESALD